MVDEAIDMILKLWSSEPPYEIEGKFWTISLKKTVDEETGIGYIHKPLQKPHPPIAMPGMSRNSPSMRTAGQRGYQPFGHCLIAGNVLADMWKTYEAGGPGSRPAAAAGRFQGGPLDLPGRHARRRPRAWPHQLAGQELRVHRPAVRQGLGPAGSTSATWP